MDDVLRHLDLAVRQGQITLLWSERVPPGNDLRAWTAAALKSADAVLLGLSAELLSEHAFLDRDLPRLSARQHLEGLRLLPLPLRPCLWRSVPDLADLRSLLPDEEGSLLSLPSARRGQAELACAQAILASLTGFQIEDRAPLVVSPSNHPSPSDQLGANEPSAAPTGISLAARPLPSSPLPDRPPRRTPRDPHPAPRWPWFAALLVLFAALIGATLAFGPRLLHEQRALLTTTALFTIALAAALLLTGALRATGRVAVSNQGFLGGAAAICLVLFASLKSAVLALTPPSEWLLRGRIAGLPPGREAWLSAAGCAEVSVDRQSERFALPVHGPCDQPELTLQVRVSGHESQTLKLPRPAPGAESALTWSNRPPRIATVAATLTVDHRPLPRAPVRLVAECPEAATLAPVETGSDGRFLFANLPPACTTPPLQVQITLPDGRLHLQRLQTALSDVIELPQVAPPKSAPSRPRERGAPEHHAVLVEDASHLLVKGLPPGHGLDRGHWLGLFRPGPGGDARLVGYGGVIEVTATTARVAIYYLSGARTGLSAGRLPPRPKVDKALGVVLEVLEEGRVRINLGRADGVAPGDRYRVLGAVVSDHTMAGRSLGRQEVGALEVAQVDDLFATAKVVKGSAERLSFIALER